VTALYGEIETRAIEHQLDLLREAAVERRLIQKTTTRVHRPQIVPTAQHVER
jgi:hypothetical protein